MKPYSSLTGLTRTATPGAAFWEGRDAKIAGAAVATDCATAISTMASCTALCTTAALGVKLSCYAFAFLPTFIPVVVFQVSIEAF